MRGGGVKSAERAMALLEFFAEWRRPATVKEVSQSLGWPQSSTSMLLASLAEAGYYDEEADVLVVVEAGAGQRAAAGDLHREVGGIETRDLADTGAAVDDVVPGLRNGIADRGDDAQAGNDDAVPSCCFRFHLCGLCSLSDPLRGY